jgi:benzylsuccinate CoA-transferase BbsE subunit
MLEHLRVLDLTDERGLLCGRLLADLGADVVQVEPAGGSTARQAPPLAGTSAPTSMFWEAFAAGKRGVVVDLDRPDEVDELRRLAAVADIVVTSWPRTLLERHGLDPDSLRADRPELVCTVISAFGWDGPKAAYADTDLVVWAAGGPLAPHRDGDLPPLRISVPQAYLHAAADAAAGTMLAVLARGASGRGQVVDVSAQEAVGVATLARVLATAVGDDNPEWQTTPGQRTGRTDQSGSGAATPNSLKKWHCADGMVELHLSMGPAAGGFTNNLFAWLAEEGAVPERIAAWDWKVLPERLVSGELTHDDLDEARAAVRAFLLRRTKAEVLDAAIRRRLLCMAIFDMADIAGSPQLEERGFWGQVDIGDRDVRIPGRIARVRGPAGPRVRGRAPLLGEHTDVVLKEWLGQP